MYNKVKELFVLVAKQTGITETELKGLSRRKWIVVARHELMRRMRDELKLSYPEIAFFSHRKNPTTAMHGVKKAKERIDKGII